MLSLNRNFIYFYKFYNCFLTILLTNLRLYTNFSHTAIYSTDAASFPQSCQLFALITLLLLLLLSTLLYSLFAGAQLICANGPTLLLPFFANLCYARLRNARVSEMAVEYTNNRWVNKTIILCSNMLQMYNIIIKILTTIQTHISW